MDASEMQTIELDCAPMTPRPDTYIKGVLKGTGLKAGEPISTRAMLEYFAPLMDYLKKQNEGREVGW